MGKDELPEDIGQIEDSKNCKYPADGEGVPFINSMTENSPGLKDAILQATDGYSIIVFGYGYSGAGKSYTLLDDDKKESILFQFVNDDKIKKGSGINIELNKIYELYGWYDIENRQMESEVIYLDDELKGINSDYYKFLYPTCNFDYRLIISIN